MTIKVKIPDMVDMEYVRDLIKGKEYELFSTEEDEYGFSYDYIFDEAGIQTMILTTDVANRVSKMGCAHLDFQAFWEIIRD